MVRARQLWEPLQTKGLRLVQRVASGAFWAFRLAAWYELSPRKCQSHSPPRFRRKTRVGAVADESGDIPQGTLSRPHGWQYYALSASEQLLQEDRGVGPCGCRRFKLTHVPFQPWVVIRVEWDSNQPRVLKWNLTRPTSTVRFGHLGASPCCVSSQEDCAALEFERRRSSPPVEDRAVLKSQGTKVRRRQISFRNRRQVEARSHSVHQSCGGPIQGSTTSDAKVKEEVVARAFAMVDPR